MLIFEHQGSLVEQGTPHALFNLQSLWEGLAHHPPRALMQLRADFPQMSPFERGIRFMLDEWPLGRVLI